MDVPGRGQPRPLSHEAEELAALYGTEARRLFGDRRWEDVEPMLASRWCRVRGGHALEWVQVRSRVQAAWLGAHAPRRRCS